MALQGQSRARDHPFKAQFRVLRYKDKVQHNCHRGLCRYHHLYKEAQYRFRDLLKCKVKGTINFKARYIHPRCNTRDHNRYQGKGLRARDLHYRCRAHPAKQQYHKISLYQDNQLVVLRDHKLHIILQEE
jgi:hypothetical protein